MGPNTLANTVRAILAELPKEMTQKNATQLVVAGVLQQMAQARNLPPQCHPPLIGTVDPRVQQPLQAPSLVPFWDDPLSAGWALQYANDPAREALDARILHGDKVTPAELATKTQLFTERYLIQWIIQNTLGPLWLEICKKNNWSPDVETTGLLQRLAKKQKDWEQKRHDQTVPRNMAIPGLLPEEGQWVYYVNRATTPTVDTPTTLRDVRILDPACGGGHFLIECFETLLWMYREEAKHRNETWSDNEIRRWIVSDNLFGIDIDSTAIQTAAAAIQLRAQLGYHSDPICSLNLATATDPLGFLLPDGHPRTAALTQLTEKGDLGFLSERTNGERLEDILEGSPFHIVLGNPPYQSMGRTTGLPLLEQHYPEGRHDLYAAFLQRSLQRCMPGGRSALLTMRGWMFIQRFEPLRTALLSEGGLELIGDIGQGAFSSLNGEIVSAAISVFRKGVAPRPSLAVRPTDFDGQQNPQNKQASLQCAPTPQPFSPVQLQKLPGRPLVYWWSDDFIKTYLTTPLLGDSSPVRQGMATGDNGRFLRRPWEVHLQTIFREKKAPTAIPRKMWVPYIKGAAGKSWLEPLDDILLWEPMALAVRTFFRDGRLRSRPQNASYYFKMGTCFSKIGRHFSARKHRYASVFDVAGSTVFTADSNHTTCLLNSRRARQIIADLNPTVNFQVGDVKRLPLLPITRAEDVFSRLEIEFSRRERHRETSVEFQQPGSHAWPSAQQWAQQTIDSNKPKPPPWQPTDIHPTPEDRLSFAVGVALGRFARDGTGICQYPPPNSLADGILYLSATEMDSLRGPAAQPILDAWRDHYTSANGTLRKQLCQKFFVEHCRRYAHRPIYFPISSSKKNFVAFISIHRWSENTLQTLLLEHLVPDLEFTRSGQRQELLELIQATRACAEKGPPPSAPGSPYRERDMTLQFDINDGIQVNSAAIWPLLHPQWKKPKSWWRTLALGTKRPDFDWSKQAQRYFPTRVGRRCTEEPSLALAHGTLWLHHPEIAWRFELRLQQELSKDFSIEEPTANQLRNQFLKMHPDAAIEILRREFLRRHRIGLTVIRIHHPCGTLNSHHQKRIRKEESSLSKKLNCVVNYTEGNQ